MFSPPLSPSHIIHWSPNPQSIMSEAAQPTHEAPDAQPENPAEIQAQVDKLIAEGKKAIALKQWEEGSAKYADALDLKRQLVGEFDPSMAPLLLSYGKALYELAFTQAGVMGKEEVEKQAGGEAVKSEGGSGNFVFSADPVSDDEVEDTEEAGQPEASGSSVPQAEGAEGLEGEGESGEGEGEEVEEPEDDYNAAWEVLDVARTIYAKMVEGKPDGEVREERLNLAETYLALGDVSCETENFPQAVQDYTSALEIKSALLPASSRSLASVHYQLATVLEFTPNRRSDALSHVESAVGGFKARLAELSSSGKVSEEVEKLSAKEKEKEAEEVKALIGDLEAKIEELKANPTPAGDLVSESINHLLGSDPGAALESILSGAGTSGGGDAPVNDLTSMVKRKPKKVVPANGTTGLDKGKGVEGQANGVKRTAEENGESAEKKAKVA